ncbi:hypothetical protein HBH64_164050 [Parastagonospora nodorum]|nr:hypothetical protein HBH43_179460 [Parastagonospora nodorum]KAH4294303.1 hypothetical protein HBI01_164930 [Parastagonospora nodorum]KAH4297382.1 hypothetical protein HBI02_164670 [Parastagonospora nodorum]KAH4325611.1 hypothetical protein HBI00_151620 [Parastagonospora nodorum]KAH4363187.1 hypothetical protein HBH94_171010 [Parastagonospora nodorum]
MSHNTPSSPLETLPPEIFNRILDYIFDPAQSEVPESTTNFRTYVFDTGLLRVNKALHKLAKSHLHLSLSWIRFDINWGAFLIDPHWLCIPYIAIDRTDAPRVLPFLYAGDMKRRTPNQRAPHGRLIVRIKFPQPTTQAQREMQAESFNSPSGSFMSVLVLERDFDRFIDVLRMNDLAYCSRVLPDAGTSSKVLSMRSVEGLSLDIKIRAGLEESKYKHLLRRFTILSGPFHQLTIEGHADPASAATLVSKVEMRMQGLGRKLQIMKAKNFTYHQAIKYLLKLKYQGDIFLRMGHHANAYTCYEYALKFEKYWQAHDLQPAKHTFWHIDKDICKAWSIALGCNLAMAAVAGGLKVRIPLVHGRSMMRNISALVDMRARRGGISMDRYLELLFSNAFCLILQEHDGKLFDNCAVLCLHSCLQAMSSAWETLSEFTTRQDSSSPTAKLYSYAKKIMSIPGVVRVRQAEDHGNGLNAEINEEDLTREIMEHIDAMRQIMLDATFEPMVWGIRKELFPNPLLSQLRVWPVALIMSGPEIPVRPEAESRSGPEANRPADLDEMTKELYWPPKLARVGEEVCIPNFDDVNREALSRGAKEERLFI